MTSDISSKEKGMLSTIPVWLSVILIPLATPRFSAGTELMTELEFGDANSDLPRPNSTRLINTEPYEDLSFKVENQISALAFRARPAELKTRLPYLSASLPAIGPSMSTITSIGINKMPVFRALYPNISCRYRDLKNGPQLKAKEFKKLVEFPAAKSLILKRVRSSVGYFCLSSTNITMTKTTSPPTRIAMLRLEVGSPIVKPSKIVSSPIQNKIEPA